MAQVFLSYDRDDGAKARAIAQALERAGHSVWWDLHVRGGTQYAKVIDEALKASDAVVVLWSAQSIESAWVRDEAAAGRDSGRLVPVSLDRTEPPLGFRQFQTIDFSQWKGRGRPALLRTLLADVEAMAGAIPPDHATAKVAPTVASSERFWLRPGAWVSIVLLLGAIAVALVWRPWADKGPALVSVTAANTDRASVDLAHDLTVNLGSLAGVQSESFRLVSQSEGQKQRPDLMLQAASAQSDHAVRASVVLMSGDHTILWASDFEQPAGNLPDLKRQVAFTSARVLGCTMDGMQADKRLKRETLKTYLNACARLEDILSDDARPVVPMLLEVIHDAPRFAPAWRRLLLAELDSVSVVGNEGERPDPGTIATLRNHISQARQVEPRMAEALLAEAALAPPRSFGPYMALVERAVRQSPDEADALNGYAYALGRVGRMDEAVKFAKQAADLDPLSPSAFSSYVQMLAYSGRTEAAERELHNAERLWAGTRALRDAQYRFLFRYGDPKLALAMEESDTPGGMQRMLLQTRIDPSPANITAFLSKIDQIFASMRNPSAGVGFAILANGAFGKPDKVLAILGKWAKPDDLGVISESFFRPELAQVRQDPKFMAIAKRAGLLEYWQASGKWPDFCFEPNLPYDCKIEGAKLS